MDKPMETPMDKRIAVLASGTGTLLQALIDDGLPIAKVYTDRLCPAYTDVAKDLPRSLVQRTFGKDFDRELYTGQLVEALRENRIDLVVMAGFMTVLSPAMFHAFGGRITNIHPSLLPAFKGAHAVRDALAAGVAVTGTTVHIATELLDDGRILAQMPVPVLPSDTEETLHERIKQAERVLYPKAIRTLLKTL